jgi:hypothetical protein
MPRKQLGLGPTKKRKVWDPKAMIHAVNTMTEGGKRAKHCQNYNVPLL